jgi:beta-galactosidase
VTYVGTLPDPELGAALARWIQTTSLPQTLWPDRPVTVTTTSAHNNRGDRIWFVSNWSFQPAEVAVAMTVKDLVDGASLAGGDRITLGAWDMRLLIET